MLEYPETLKDKSMRLSVLGLILAVVPLMGMAEVNFRNDREADSYYSSGSDKRAAAKALKQVDGTHIIGAFHEILKDTDENKACSFDINASLIKKLREKNKKFSEVKGAVLHLRYENEIDDSVAKMLIEADEVSNAYLALPKDRESIFYPSEQTLKESLSVIKNFEKKLKTSCFDEAYRSLYGDLIRVDKHLKTSNIEAIFTSAYEQKLISYETYVQIEKARISEYEQKSATLSGYLKKINNLRMQYPLRDPEERSKFVSAKANKQKISHRQRLLESYSDIQIIMMANVIKKLRTRIEAPKAEILIYDRNQGVETITLEPMERFRLAIKLLRKEMSLLALNTFFAGRAPDYMDLMTAAFETGIIPASELEEVAGLEEIWNPKKTFWEKAQVWVRMAGSVASIALPPPYGFIPALVIVVIEMTAGQNSSQSENDPTVLF
jgi:hypothetical protein